jgi:hypothetical protein
MPKFFLRLFPNSTFHILLIIFWLKTQPSASSFSFQYLLLFLKSSRGCVLLLLLLLLLPTPFTSVICPSMVPWRRQFLLIIWLFQLDLICRILFRSVHFSPICSRTSSLVTFSDHFISILLQLNISKLSKHFRSNFLSVQVFEPYKAMLQKLTANQFFPEINV